MKPENFRVSVEVFPGSVDVSSKLTPFSLTLHFSLSQPPSCLTLLCTITRSLKPRIAIQIQQVVKFRIRPFLVSVSKRNEIRVFEARMVPFCIRNIYSRLVILSRQIRKYVCRDRGEELLALFFIRSLDRIEFANVRNDK